MLILKTSTVGLVKMTKVHKDLRETLVSTFYPSKWGFLDLFLFQVGEAQPHMSNLAKIACVTGSSGSSKWFSLARPNQQKITKPPHIAQVSLRHALTTCDSKSDSKRQGFFPWNKSMTRKLDVWATKPSNARPGWGRGELG